MTHSVGPSVSVTAIIPAFDEQARLPATIEALTEVSAIDHLLVVDDGSSDATANVGRAAGAEVLELGKNRGKGAAMESGVRFLWSKGRATEDDHVLLFLDADLQSTAGAAEVLIPPVTSGATDMCIANLPTQDASGGGHGFVVELARAGIRQATGEVMKQPLSGQRAMTTRAFKGALPLARGFGVEVGLTIDVLRAGLRVIEVPSEFQHRVTGRDFKAQVHRANQFYWVWRALRGRGVGPALPLPRRTY
ncbi:MAG: glycosyltransferase family 2 protein [Actinomycetes bacterium]